MGLQAGYPSPRASAASCGSRPARLGPIGQPGGIAGTPLNYRLVADNSFDVITRFDRNWRAGLRVAGREGSPGLHLRPNTADLPWQDPASTRMDLHALAARRRTAARRRAASATVSYRRYRPDGGIVWLESTFRRLQDGSGYVGRPAGRHGQEAGGRPSPPPGPPRYADGPGQPCGVRHRAWTTGCASTPAPGSPLPCSRWTWTGSRKSTIPSATGLATCC